MNIGLHGAGILMHQGRFLELPSHIDVRHIAALEGPQQPTHFGTIELWANKRLVDVPFLSIAGIGTNNTIYTDDDWITYDVISARDGSITFMQDLSGSDSPGKGKTEFDILIKGHQVSPGLIFKFDKQQRLELQMTAVKKQGDNTVVTVRRLDSSDPVDTIYLQSGNKLQPMTNVMSPEFGQDYGSMHFANASGPRYRIPVGQIETNVHYSISTKALTYHNDLGVINVPQSTKKLLDDSFEYFFKIPSLDNSGLVTLSDAIKAQPVTVDNAMKEGKVSVALSTLYDSLALKYLARGEQEYMVWGTGGYGISFGGLDEALAPVGAWQQLDSGYVTTFNLANATLDMFKAAITEYVHGKVQYPAAGSEPTIEVQTGKGGFELANRWITDAKNDQSIIVHAKDFGSITGAGPMNLSYSPLWYNELKIPMLCNLRFVYNPAFEQIEANELTNPMMPSGYRLSSYSFIIHEVNDFGGNGNIKIVRSRSGGGKVFMNVINGSSVSHPMFRQQGPQGVIVTQSAHLGNGYQAYFRKKMDSLWIVDPTRVLKLVPIDPRTGKHF